MASLSTSAYLILPRKVWYLPHYHMPLGCKVPVLCFRMPGQHCLRPVPCRKLSHRADRLWQAIWKEIPFSSWRTLLRFEHDSEHLFIWFLCWTHMSHISQLDLWNRWRSMKCLRRPTLSLSTRIHWLALKQCRIPCKDLPDQEVWSRPKTWWFLDSACFVAPSSCASRQDCWTRPYQIAKRLCSQHAAQSSRSFAQSTL